MDMYKPIVEVEEEEPEPDDPEVEVYICERPILRGA